MDIELTQEQQEMVLENWKLVHYIVRKLGIFTNDYEDMVSIGTIGLIKAAATFDLSKKIKFSTYASRCIKNEVFMTLRESKGEPISLNEPISQDGDGKEVTIMDTLTNSETSGFEDRLENAEVITKALNYVLNCLTPRDAVALLLSMADTLQNDIANIIGISQPCVSRLIPKLHSKLKQNYEETNYEEVFTMAVKDDRFEVKFSTADVGRFNQIFANFLVNTNSTKYLQRFKVDCSREQVVIYLPADTESFAFVACIIKEIDNFSMSSEGYSQISSKNDEKGDPAVKENHIEVKNEGGEVASVANTEIANLEEEFQIKSSTMDLQPKTKNVDGNASTEEKVSNTETPIKAKANSSNLSISAQVREYILSKDSFFVSELKEKFPGKSAIISNVLQVAKNRGVISSDKRGHYIVKK